MLVADQILDWLLSNYAICCVASVGCGANILMVLEQISQWLGNKYPIGCRASTQLVVNGCETNTPLFVDQITDWWVANALLVVEQILS